MNLVQGKIYKMIGGHSFCHTNKMDAILYLGNKFDILNKKFIFLDVENMHNGKLYKIFCEGKIRYFCIFDNNEHFFKVENL